MTGGPEKDLENAAELGSLEDVVYLWTILENGTSADRHISRPGMRGRTIRMRCRRW
jgi:hypothetical protein